MSHRDQQRLATLARTLGRRALRTLRTPAADSFTTVLRRDPQAPAVLLSPHWDDAVLSCWGLLADDLPLRVVNVFGGLPPAGHTGVWERVGGVRDSRERAQRRAQEDAAALAGAGREALNLPLVDIGFRRRREDISLDALDAALAAQIQSVSRVYAPSGIGGHTDHVFVREYARALLRAGIEVELYAEPPYCVFHGWPSWVDGRPPEPARNVDAYWESFLGDVPELPPLRSGNVEQLDPQAAAAKLSAIGMYELSLNHGARRMLAEPVFHAFEVRWRLALGAQGPR